VTSPLRGALELFSALTLGYFVVLNVIYLLLTVASARDLAAYLRKRRTLSGDDIFRSPFTPGISVIVPAFNEEAGIVESVRSLLDLRYPLHEVLVVNDGSTDGTVDRLRDAFGLVAAPRAARTAIVTTAVRATYVSLRYPNLWLFDKENGGKADALNAGINAARHPYVCAVDADALIEVDALLAVVAPIVDDPDLVVATGGIVRIANGCVIDHGRITSIRLPRSPLAVFQVVEYFRAFLIGRVGWSRANALLVISGAFGLFSRAAVEEVGGYWPQTVGEDAELVLRLHHHLRRIGRPYRISFVADPVCWTEAPEDLRTLGRQRRRWHRGLGQALWRHRTMIARPRYGVFGMLVLPYFLIFELFGPVVELVGFAVVIAAFVVGAVSVPFLVAFLVMSVLLGVAFSVAALALEEFSFHRHTHSADVVRMGIYALAENFGYRQLNDMWRAVGLVDLARRRGGWGAQRRKGIGVAPSQTPRSREAGTKRA
jgi:cellulose synthase/poly-beta-1,6-N-acetylglucosamine synthase-like glycosyltransferase